MPAATVGPETLSEPPLAARAFLCLGETDEWAHLGDDPRYLQAAHRVVEDYSAPAQ